MTGLQVHGVALLQASDEEIRRAAALVHNCLQRGSLRPVVALELPFSQAGAAHEEVIARGVVKAGNIVLSWTPAHLMQ